MDKTTRMALNAKIVAYGNAMANWAMFDEMWLKSHNEYDRDLSLYWGEHAAKLLSDITNIINENA